MVELMDVSILAKVGKGREHGVQLRADAEVYRWAEAATR
jgi:hypothetical protein